MLVFLSQGLQSGGGHAPILAPGCPNTGGLARVREIAITTRHTLAPRSAETGTRSASEGRGAFHRRGARASAVRLVIRLLNDVFVESSFAFVSCDFPHTCFASLQYDSVGGAVGQEDAAARCGLFAGRVWSDRVHQCESPLPNKAPRVSTSTASHKVLLSSGGN